jgi:hypothetical protein
MLKVESVLKDNKPIRFHEWKATDVRIFSSKNLLHSKRSKLLIPYHFLRPSRLSTLLICQNLITPVDPTNGIHIIHSDLLRDELQARKNQKMGG